MECNQMHQNTYIACLKVLLALISFGLILADGIHAQNFGPQDVIHYANHGPKIVIAEDLDQDGDKDVISGSYWNTSLSWYENDGNENFTRKVITQQLANVNDVAVIDLNGDGRKDIISSSFTYIKWFKNAGQQNFIKDTIAKINNANKLKPIDLNKDGHVDLIAAIEGTNQIVWFKNDGQQNFTKILIAPNVNKIKDIAVGDLTGNQAIDILAATPQSQTLIWYENDGHQNFTSRVLTNQNRGINSVHIADVNKDQKPDILSTSYVHDEVTWYENDSNQSFNSQLVSDSYEGPYDVKTADLNGNGYQDVLVPFFYEDKLVLFHNDINQNFQPDTISTRTEGATGVNTGDINGDGKPDILSTSYNDYKVSWYKNQMKFDSSNGPAFNCSENHALQFDGKDDEVRAGLGKGNGKVYKNWTWSAWIKPDNWSNGKRSGILVSGEDRSKRNLNLTLENGQLKHYRGSAAGAILNYDVSNLKGWHQVGIVQNRISNQKVKLKLILDGKAVDSIEGDFENMKTDYLTIGATFYPSNKTKSTHYYNGLIDDVKMWSQAQPISELNSLNCDCSLDSNNMIAYWNFNGCNNNKVEEVINDYDGLLIPNDSLGPQWTHQFPKKNCKKEMALDFDGVDDEVRAGLGKGNGKVYKNWTWSAWIRPDNWNNGKRSGILVSGEDRSKRNLNLTLENGRLKHYRGSAAGAILNYDVSTLKGWHQVGIVQNRISNQKVKLKLILNGKAVDSIEGDYENMKTDYLTMGATFYPSNKTKSTHYYNGFIDDVKIWNKAKIASAITSSYCSGTGDSNKLVAYWHFNDGNACAISDRMNNYPGQLYPNSSSGPQSITKQKDFCETKPSINLACKHHPSAIQAFNQGTNKDGSSINSKRSQVQNMLGTPDDQFFSLGFADSAYAVLAFDSFMTGELTLYEESWGSSNYLEEAHVYVSEEGKNWKYVGNADNQNNPANDIHPYTFTLDSLRYQYVKVVDVTDSSKFGSTDDGYDINAICAEEIAPIQTKNPKPACRFFVDKVIEHEQGTYKNGQSISQGRSNPQNALGTPDLPVYSLGFQSHMNQKPYVILGFKGLMTGKLSLYEYNNNPLETADVYVGTDTNHWTYVGKAHNFTKVSGNLFATTFDLDSMNYRYVKLVNTSNKTPWGPKGDGFDLVSICAEGKASILETISNGCFTVKHIFTKNNGDGTVTKRFKVINNCLESWDYTAFELKAGTKALSANSGGNYPVINTTYYPFHSIKYECNKPSCFSNGQSQWFEYTLPITDTMASVKVKSKAGNNGSSMVFGTESGGNTTSFSAKSDQNLSVYPNPISRGNILNIQLEKKVNDYNNVQVISSQGKIIKEGHLNKRNGKLQLETKSLQKGIYIIRINNYYRKVILQ